MHRNWAFCISILLIFLAATPALSQRKGHRNLRAKKRSIIECPIFVKDKYPYHGIGVMVGDPTALTYKFYLNENFGVVVDAGKASSGLYSRYFREQLDGDIPYDTLSSESEIDYLSHRVSSDWVGALKFLWHFDAKGITPGLRIYIGVGAQAKLTKLTYQYIYTSPPISGQTNTLGSYDKTINAFGPQFSVGIEYSYFQIPISAFMELELFNDVSYEPGRTRFQGGAGLRYVF